MKQAQDLHFAAIDVVLLKLRLSYTWKIKKEIKIQGMWYKVGLEKVDDTFYRFLEIRKTTEIRL